MNGGWGISYEIALTDDQSTLVQVMAWCRQATSHYLSQCWPRSLSPYDVTRPQWVNSLRRWYIWCIRLCSSWLPHFLWWAITWLSQCQSSHPKGYMGKIMDYIVYAPYPVNKRWCCNATSSAAVSVLINARISGSHPNHYTFIFVSLMHVMIVIQSWF